MRLVLAVLALCALAPDPAAQQRGRTAPGGAVVSLDALTAYDDAFVTDENGALLGEGQVVANAVLLSGRVPVSERLSLRAEVPLATILYSDALTGAENRFAVGNPMIGAEVQLPAPSRLDAITASAEVRLPLANGTASGSYGDAAFVGSFSDRQRFEAYEGKTASLLVRVAAALAPTPTSTVTIALAPVVAYTSIEVEQIPGVDQDYARSNWGVLASAVGDVRLGRASVGAGLLGRYEPRSGSLIYESSVFADATLHAALEGLPVRPGVQLVLPVTPRYARAPGAVLGLSLDVPLR